jgi:ribosome-binding protein aMBF1 (putative translation factor)
MKITRIPSVEDVENRLLAAGWTRREIAARLSEEVDIDETTWRRWRNGETEPTHSAWTRVVDHVINLKLRKKREKRNDKKLGSARNGTAKRTRV